MPPRIEPHMAPEQNPNPGKASPTLFFVIGGLIILFLAAFLILRPHPPGSGTSTSPAAPAR